MTPVCTTGSAAPSPTRPSHSSPAPSSRSSPVPPWRSFVALGDSFTEGLADVDPAEAQGFRGWADLLAQRLSHRRVAAGHEPLQYANLAVRGRLLLPILDEQVPRASTMAPDLVSIIGGGNDMLRHTGNLDTLLTKLEQAVAHFRDRGIDVLMGTGMDMAHAPVVRLTRRRVGLYNSGIWSIAHRQGAYVLDLWGMASLKDERMWAPDRIHLATDGHARTAEAALVTLGLTPTDPDWDEPLAPGPSTEWLDRRRSDVRWLRQHAYPWLRRRIRRTSSGDGVTAKYPALAPIDVSDGGHDTNGGQTP